MISTSIPQATELAQLRTRVRLLKEMATHINSGLDLQQLVERTILEAHKSLPEYRISYMTLDEAQNLCVEASVEPADLPSAQGKRFRVVSPELLDDLLAGTSVVIADVVSDPRIRKPETMAEIDTRAALIVPVKHPQKLRTFLALSSGEANPWQQHEIDLVSDIADHLAISIRQSCMQAERDEMDRHLRESQKMEAVGQLVGGVAHDFNNLLTGMMIYSGLLATALGEHNPLQRHVREIKSAGERGATLVAQLLSLSRSHVLELRLLSLNDVVGGVRDMLQRLMGEEVLIACHLAGELSRARIDENQLRQAILNLAINARDAMKRGGTLKLATTNVMVDESLAKRVPALAPGAYVRLSVSDTGEGMTAHTLEHCFEPFFTTKPQGEGTGLGLAAVYGMVTQHGGGITVSSSPGEGTTFELYFAVADGEVVRPDRSATNSTKHTLLLVEDEDLLRIPLAEHLQADGYKVLSAANGESALSSAKRYSGTIDLLITDLVMPGMSGMKLAENFAVTRPEMAVLYVSGYTNDERARRLIAEGAEFLRKPFTAEAFSRKVGQLIEDKKMVRGHQTRQQKSTSILGKET
ncbi:MAG TPA: ATP-binding protein [Terriglobales bacterium]|nr:ATP-binding protein [Terriglobales bacterium]